jgi:hypothetical protein
VQCGRPGARTETGAQPESLSSKPEINSNANRVASLKEHLLPGLDDELPRMAPVSESVAKSPNTVARLRPLRLGVGSGWGFNAGGCSGHCFNRLGDRAVVLSDTVAGLPCCEQGVVTVVCVQRK